MKNMGLSLFMNDPYPLAGRIGVCSSPFDFFEIGAFCCSNFRLAPRPRALSLAMSENVKVKRRIETPNTTNLQI